MANVINYNYLRDKMRNIKPIYWMMGALLSIVATAYLIMSQLVQGIDPSSWTCDNIKPFVIESSNDNNLNIFEIGDVAYNNNLPNYEIKCFARAETSAGPQHIEYGAHVTEGGSVIVTYELK